MAAVRNNFFILCLTICFLLSLVTDWYSFLSIALFVLTVFAILDKLGKGLLLREIVVLHAIFICLVMPVLGYQVYNHENTMARLFYKYMVVPEDVYFSYNLPALCVFSISMCFPITKGGVILDEGDSFKSLLQSVRNQLRTRFKTGIIIVLTGTFSLFLITLIPQDIRFVVTLFYFSSFAGILYIYYGPAIRSKNFLLILFTVFVVGLAIQSAIFTVVVYMGMTIFSFLFLGRRYAMWKKFTVFVVGCFLLFIIQNVKTSFRDITWGEKVVDNKAGVFGDVIVDKLSNMDKLVSVGGFFPVYMRTNQGINISLVMRRIPARQDYDNGSRLFTTAFSALVPRILWQNKPEAGGKATMKYFTGQNIVGWSTNVGPLGEAYGSFGPVGAIVYMFVLGLFIRWAYFKIFVVGQRLPLVILWIPVLFYQVTYCMETDSLQIFNSLTKGAFFLWMLYKIFPSWFGVLKKQPNIRRTPRRSHSPA
ncbi:MAG: hypothetical protein Q8918_16555 [Bacteroidota bacterium]|nr:hypothetical protein [Bacteroidota bacterium]